MNLDEMDAFLLASVLEDRDIDAGLERALTEIADDDASEVRKEREEA